MRWWKYIVAVLLASVCLSSMEAKAETHDENADVDVAELVFGHIGDSYGWHITTWEGEHITIPLPCIVYGSTGWHVFMSSRLEHGEIYEGFFISEDDKIMEMLPDGSVVKPFDISITKNVASLMISALLLIIIILGTARWYKKHDVMKEGSPKGFAGLVEMLVDMVTTDLIKPSIDEKYYRKYTPFLLTVFFFIFLSNLLGIVPFFPGGANVTGNIAVTMVLALFTFFMVNLFADKHYWKEILWPEAPIFLKFPLPIMQIIEIFGMVSKPFSLMVRLFANILAGHAMILGLVAVIFVTAKLGPVINGSMTGITLVFGVFMDCLELLVGFIQAYVFTMLSDVFIGMSRQGGH
jgi:F-type H+-transporting ATPase subunit a